MTARGELPDRTDGVEMPSAVRAAADVRSGRRPALDLVEECLARIDERDAELNAFVFVDRDGARRAAELVDREVAEGRGD